MIQVDPIRTDGPTASVITLDRAERRNALDIDHCLGLAEAVTAGVEAGDRALVITGSGSSFCAGADFGGVTGDGFGAALHTMLRTIVEAPIPIVAAVNGHAIGAGVQLAIACDLRVGGPDARFAVPTARLGLAVDPWTIGRLIGLTGNGPARHLLMSCRTIDGATAARIGLVDESGTVDDATALAADLATMAPLTLRYIKQAANAATPELDRAAVTDAFEACWKSHDLTEGLAARAEGRPAAFQGA
ncbi:MAG: enoyl-CoA hydratase [Acidimicrobiales bacterium]